MSNKKVETLDDAVVTIKKAVDFYHSMDLGEMGSPHWREWWQAGLDLLERVQGLDEHSLYNAHIDKCIACQEQGLEKSGYYFE